MTAIPQSASSALDYVPQRISDPLRQIAQRHWLVLAAVGVFQTLITGLAALLVAALILGFFPNVWAPVRIALAVLAWIAVIGSAAFFLRPALRRWSLSRAAMQVEHLHPGLQERLSSAVELASEQDPHFRGSQALVNHLVRQAEADASAVKPDEVIRTDRIVRWALYFVPVLLAWLLIALIPATTKTAMAGLYRVLMPWKNTLPALLTKVNVVPGDVTLVQGDPLDVTAHVTFDSADREAGHATLVRQFENGQKLSEDMEVAGPRDFHTHFDDLQQTFKYQVLTDQGDSTWFTATVHPRPEITNIDIRYDYPAYTGLSSKTDSGKDGSIEALVGTRVTIMVHTALPVVVEKSQIVVDGGTPEQIALPLKQVQEGHSDYQAQIVLSHSGNYRINLTNEFDLANKNEEDRTITAIPDEVPTIVVQSPEPQITVRPDDVVPVKYLATDDFGVARIEAILQVDDHEPQTVPVKFRAVDKRNVSGPDYSLSIEKVLKEQKLADADHITYQLKVTDNRDPDPQFSFSAKQTLKINKNEGQSYQAKIDQKIAQDLMAAIQKAIGDLDRNKPRVQDIQNRDTKLSLEDWQKHNLEMAVKELPQINQDLDKAADEAMDTPFEDVAKTVRKIADNPIREAAENAASAQVNAASGEDRKQAAAKSVAQITEARDALQKLLDQQAVQNDQKIADAARALEEAARRQEQAAQLMKPHDAIQNAQNQPAAQQQQQEAMQQQQQANQKLQQAISEEQALQNQQAQQLAQQLQNLINKVEELEKQQQANADQTQKQEAANQIAQKANDLAKQQEALNQEIAKNAENHKQSLQQANANPPTAEHQQNIVKALDQNQLQQAHDQMKEAANQLHQEAQQLQNQANNNELKPDDSQKNALNQEQQAQQKAQDEQNQANQAAQALNQQAQQNAVPNADNQAVHNAQQAAQEVAKQAAAEAQQAQQQASQSHEAAHAAEQAAQEAQHAAQQAQQNAQASPNDQAAQQQAGLAQQEAQAAQHEAQAAQHAAEQADKAQQEAQAAQHDAESAQHDAQAAAQAQNPQQAQQELGQASKELQQAAQELAQAAQQNTEAAKAQMLAGQQQQAQEAANHAAEEAQRQEALAQQLEQQQQQLAQVQQNQQPADQAQQQQNQQAEQTANAQHQAQDLQHAAEQAHNENVAHRAEQAQADLQQAHEQAAEAAHAEQQANAAQHEAAEAHNPEQAQAAEHHAEDALQQAAEHQEHAQEALAQAEQALRDLHQELAQADAAHEEGHEAGHEQGNEQGNENGNEQGHEEQGQGHEEGHEAGHEHGHGHHSGSPQQQMQQAAQAAQEAAQAQQEATNQQNPAAAQEAAQALAQAAQAMANAVPGSLHQGQPENGEPGQEEGAEPDPGNGPDSAEIANHAEPTPGNARDSRQGISLVLTGPNGIPAAVRDIGISPDQWAKLPPMAKKDLLNAAQQSGPPTYRQMIKDYYVKVAKLQETGR